MDESTILRFAASGGQIAIPAIVVDTEDSPHTGRPLRRLASDLTASAEDARAIGTLLEAPRLVDEHGDEWSGRIEVESYRDVQGLHSLKLAWEELEQLHADPIEFGGLSLHPSRYEERASDGGISLSFQARLSPAETERLRELQQGRNGAIYFPVVRHGVSDTPRHMRFGRVLWQALDDGVVAHDITLVEDVWDANTKASPWAALAGEPQTRHMMRAIERLSGERDALLEALKGAGALDNAAVERIREAGATARGTCRYRFYEVDDISKWD